MPGRKFSQGGASLPDGIGYLAGCLWILCGNIFKLRADIGEG
jgi:hypothetical protein